MNAQNEQEPAKSFTASEIKTLLTDVFVGGGMELAKILGVVPDETQTKLFILAGVDVIAHFNPFVAKEVTSSIILFGDMNNVH